MVDTDPAHFFQLPPTRRIRRLSQFIQSIITSESLTTSPRELVLREQTRKLKERDSS